RERTTRPAGSCGMSKVYDDARADPPSSDAMPARPVRLPTSTVITFALVCTIFPVAPPRDELSLIASGPSAGSAVTVRPGTGTRLVIVVNETTTVPLIWLIVAPLNDALGRTPVAVACRLLITTCLTVKLLALMSICFRLRAATWVRKGNPWMVTDGLVPRPEESILLAIALSAYALAPKSAATRSPISTMSAMTSPRPRCLRRLGRDRRGGCCWPYPGCCPPYAVGCSPYACG